MYFLTEDGYLFEKCNTLWDKVSADIKKEFEFESVYTKKNSKTKIKIHGNEVTNFYDKKFLSQILIILV